VSHMFAPANKTTTTTIFSAAVGHIPCSTERISSFLYKHLFYFGPFVPLYLSSTTAMNNKLQIAIINQLTNPLQLNKFSINICTERNVIITMRKQDVHQEEGVVPVLTRE